ncbi:putative leucine-rich repeat-containing protein DDB_G0290503 isoform X2 [Adelges cooleyi]|uniref:putative leucine-rich repeat-containing protein DDB_G0290503 isoform X2 n=1 Tax=Adelges cooleyi TaxID=133065 RepID=UPI00217FEE60|nr:putative leucine-rich repeat-containing protein DDB_G0290503 isoform X2 [Adelges cooleyi]
MFKKLKGSIGKIDESKTQPNSVTQNRPSLSGFSTLSPLTTEPNDSQFCIDDEIEVTPKNSPARVAVSESTTVDLGKFSQSSSSLANDHHSSFNTDLESASEIDDNVSVVSEYANEITKENLYAAYKKLHGRYHKHKNKYAELASKFKQTLLTHDKDKITMTKAQDKLLQRITELKEQCTLEQAAKAHMEEALRNDIEERDHIISTLNTKIELLRKNGEHEDDSISLSADSTDLSLTCERLNEELRLSKHECDSLQKQIECLKKSEENTLLSLAENKMAIHKELELKEDQIKKLEKTINGLQMENKILSKGNTSQLLTNANQIKIDEQVHQDMTRQLTDLEGEMSSVFECKENEIKTLKDQIKLLEKHLESQKQSNSSVGEIVNSKDKEIKDLKSTVARLELNLNDDKISGSKKIDTFLKEIGEKSQKIKNLTNQLKDVEKVKKDFEKSEQQVNSFKNEITQLKKLVDEKDIEINNVKEQNKSIAELKLNIDKKNDRIIVLEKELKALEENSNSDKEYDERLKDIDSKLKEKTEEAQIIKTQMETKDRDIHDLKSQLKIIPELSLSLEQKDKEINMLKTEAKELKEKLKNQNEKHEGTISEKVEELNLLKSQMEKENEELRELKSSKLENDKKLNKELENNTELNNIINELEDKLQQKNDLGQKAKIELEIYTNEINSLKTQVKELFDEIKVKDEQLNVIQLNNKDQETIMNNKICKLEKIIENLEQQVNKKNNIIKEIQIVENHLKDQAKEIDNEKNHLESEIIILREKVKKNDSLVHQLQEEINVMNQLNEKAKKSTRNHSNELKQKEDEIDKLKEEVKMLNNSINENKCSYSNLINELENLKAKNKSLIESEKDLKSQIVEHDNSNKRLQEIIKVVQEEKEQEAKTMKKMIEQNQFEFDHLNSLHKEMLSQLNQDKLNKISEERSIESVVKDFSLLTEENSYLKKERQKVLLMVHEMIKTIKYDFKNLKSYVFNQFTEWSLLFVSFSNQINADLKNNVQYYNDNLEKSRKQNTSVQNAYCQLKTDCLDLIDYFNKDVLDKYNEDVMKRLCKYNEKLEEKSNNVVKLQEEFDRYKKNEQLEVKAEVKQTIQELQESLDNQKNVVRDLKLEHAEYLATEKKKWTDKLIETENKWLEKMDNYKKMMDTEHREELDALTEEWNNERKGLENIIQNVETVSQREEMLQRQINKLNKELSEIKKMYRNEVHNKLSTNEDDVNDDKCFVEMEYLRNILYEYMMGKQPMVLVKVLAAIVKFDTEQLTTVLQKEEQKVSLLKSLGLT